VAWLESYLLNRVPFQQEVTPLSGILPAGKNGGPIEACGGFTPPQDRISSECFEMPAASIDLRQVEIVLPPERACDCRWTQLFASLRQGRWVSFGRFPFIWASY
jgi:hypothetical protein